MKLDKIKHLKKPEEVYGYIYGLKSPSGKWYIGQTRQELYRYIDQNYRLYKGKDRPKIRSAIEKYGFDSFDIFILESVNDLELLNESEVKYIRFYESIEKGYNCLPGGDCPEFGPMTGKTHSEETRRKISKSNSGKIISEEQKKRISECNKGKTISEEHKKALRESRLGTHHSEETRKKLSEAKIGNKNSLGFKHTDETIEKCRLSRIDFIHTEESKKKMSESKIGIKRSKETIEKIRDSKLKFKYKIMSPNGSIVDVFNLKLFGEENLFNGKLLVKLGKTKGWTLISKESVK